MEEVSKQIFIETSYDEVNVGALVTPTGVICIDVPSYARDARDWAARMHRLSPYPVQHILLTDSNGDRILNTRWLNAPLTMHQNSADLLRSYEKKYPMHLLESLSIRHPHRGRELSNGPVEHATTSFSGEITMFKHGQRITLRHVVGPNNGNAWIMLKDRNIIFAGDTLMAHMHPHLAAPTCTGWLDTLRELRELAKNNIVIAGRGEPVDDAAFETAIDYLETMRTKVEDHISAEKPREALVTYIPQFLTRFPLASRPQDWVQQQIRLSLGYIYDEVQSPETVVPTPE